MRCRRSAHLNVAPEAVPTCSQLETPRFVEELFEELEHVMLLAAFEHITHLLAPPCKDG
jgi:hypothetical protein